jgi:hypothetical protein
MKRIVCVVVAMAFLAAWIPAAIAEDTLDSVEKTVTENWNKLTSVSSGFDLAAQVKMKPEQPNPFPVVGGGQIDYVKKGETIQYKAYVWAGLTPTVKMAQAQALFDGKDGYYDAMVPLASVNESGTVPASDLIAPGGKPLFDALKANFTDLAVAPSEKIGDKDCFVIKGVLKNQDPKIPISKGMLYLAKDTGVPMKVVVVDAAGAEMGSIAMKGVKTNGPVDPGAFVHTPLQVPGVPGAPAAPAPADKAAPAPAPAAKAEPAKAEPAKK